MGRPHGWLITPWARIVTVCVLTAAIVAHLQRVVHLDGRILFAMFLWMVWLPQYIQAVSLEALGAAASVVCFGWFYLALSIYTLVLLVMRPLRRQSCWSLYSRYAPCVLLPQILVIQLMAEI